MATAASKAQAETRSKLVQPVLDPLERSSEILFGVIMVMTFTVSLRVARADHLQVREMLIGALGCNLAWGVIDGIMYVMSCVSERGHSIKVLRRVHKARSAEEANQIISDELPPVVAAVLPSPALNAMRENLLTLPDPPARPRLKLEDWRGAASIFLLVFLSTLPLIIPFILIPRLRMAARVSDLIGLVMLFFSGRAYGKYAGHSTRGWGIAMVLLGGVMVGLTIALGG
jgi:uncharacterized membrane protein YjgN (DUF898 family)